MQAAPVQARGRTGVTGRAGRRCMFFALCLLSLGSRAAAVDAPPGGVPATLLFGVEAASGDTRTLFQVQARIADSTEVPDAYRGCYVTASGKSGTVPGRMNFTLASLSCVHTTGTARSDVRGYLVGVDKYLGLRGTLQNGILKIKPGQNVTVVFQER